MKEWFLWIRGQDYRGEGRRYPEKILNLLVEYFLWWVMRGFVFAKAKTIRGASPQKISNKFEISARLLPRANPPGSHPAISIRNKNKPLRDFFLFLVGDEGLEPPTFSV